jgi:hypothetical protein
MSELRYPSDKSVEVIVRLKAYRDQAAIVSPNPKPGFEINGSSATTIRMLSSPWPKFSTSAATASLITHDHDSSPEGPGMQAIAHGFALLHGAAAPARPPARPIRRRTALAWQLA